LLELEALNKRRGGIVFERFSQIEGRVKNYKELIN